MGFYAINLWAKEHGKNFYHRISLDNKKIKCAHLLILLECSNQFGLLHYTGDYVLNSLCPS